MRKFAFCLALVSLLALGGAAFAEIGTIDDVPAATLLLPYFECELDNNLVPTFNNTTLFSINNASAAAVLTHVTFWTDESIPTLDFDIYLTGYDVQTLNVCDVFNGILPVTADRANDPSDVFSPSPPIGGVSAPAPQELTFPGCAGRLPYVNPELGATLLAHLRNAHTGRASAVFGNRCSGFNFGDNIARGYITVDVVTQCSLDFPSDPGYFAGIADFDNVIWGDYFYVDNAGNFAQGETLVHIEACEPGNGYLGFVGTGTSGVNTCPMAPGDYTFYGRYVAGTGADQRESLSTQFATRYLNGGPFDGGTNLYVWRDSKTAPGAPGAPNGPFTCGGNATWFPLGQSDIVAFDEQENPTDLCFQGDNVSPAIGGADACFPLEAQCVSLAGGNLAGDDPTPPADFGWMFLNLNTSLAGGLFNPTAQAWVTTVMSAEGRYSVGFDAIQLDNANQTFQSATPGGVILQP